MTETGERKLSAREMQTKRLMEEREDRFWANDELKRDQASKWGEPREIIGEQE